MIEEVGWPWILALAIDQVTAFMTAPENWLRVAREDVETVGIDVLGERLTQQLDVIERLYPASERDLLPG